MNKSSCAVTFCSSFSPMQRIRRRTFECNLKGNKTMDSFILNIQFHYKRINNSFLFIWIGIIWKTCFTLCPSDFMHRPAECKAFSQNFLIKWSRYPHSVTKIRWRLANIACECRFSMPNMPRATRIVKRTVHLTGWRGNFNSDPIQQGKVSQFGTLKQGVTWRKSTRI